MKIKWSKVLAVILLLNLLFNSGLSNVIEVVRADSLTPVPGEALVTEVPSTQEPLAEVTPVPTEVLVQEETPIPTQAPPTESETPAPTDTPVVEEVQPTETPIATTEVPVPPTEEPVPPTEEPAQVIETPIPEEPTPAPTELPLPKVKIEPADPKGKVELPGKVIPTVELPPTKPVDEVVDPIVDQKTVGGIEINKIISPVVNTRTYEFYVNGDLKTRQIIKSGESLVKPASPALGDCQTFTGWYTAIGTPEQALVSFGEAITFSTTQTIRVDAGITSECSVYFVVEGSVVTTKTVVQGGTVNANNVPVVITGSGLGFSHWSTSTNGSAFNFGTAINTNTTLYAVLASMWQVTFNTNGGSYLEPVYVPNNTALTQPAYPTRAGYTFAGWLLNGSPYNFSTAVTSPITLLASWNVATTPYKVVIWLENANDTNYSYYQTRNRTGQTGNPATYTQETIPYFTYSHRDPNVTISGDGSTILNVYYTRNVYWLKFVNRWNTVNVIDPVEVKHGYSTKYWWDLASAEEPTWEWRENSASGSKNVEPPLMPTEDLTFYGRREGDDVYTVMFMEIPDASSTDNATLIRELDTYTADVDYVTFSGGRELIGFTWRFVTKPGKTWDYPAKNDATGRYEVKTYYTRNQYTISFVPNGGAPVPDVSIYYDKPISGANPSSSYQIGTTTKIVDGMVYTFAGWYPNEAVLGDAFAFTGNMPANNIILYAKWLPPTYNVVSHETIDPASTTKTVVVPRGGTTTAGAMITPTTPPGGGTFIGWYWYPTGAFVAYDFTTPIFQDVELFPVWSTTTYKVTYDLNGGTGSVVDDGKYQIGSDAIIKSAAGVTPPANKVFLGWQLGQTLYAPNDTLPITGNVTLVAMWENVPAPVGITYHSNYPYGTNGQFPVSNLDNNSTHTVLTLAAASFAAPAGYTFKGWTVAQNGTGTLFAPALM